MMDILYKKNSTLRLRGASGCGFRYRIRIYDEKFKEIKSWQNNNFFIIKGQAGSLPSKQIVSWEDADDRAVFLRLLRFLLRTGEEPRISCFSMISFKQK